MKSLWSLSTRPAFGAFALAFALIVGAITLHAPLAHALKPRKTQDASAYTLRRIYKPGETNRYKLVSNSSVSLPEQGNSELSFLLNMTLKETVEKGKAEGSTLLTTEVEAATAKVGEQEQDITTLTPKVKRTVDKNGSVVETMLDNQNNPFADQLGAAIRQLLDIQTAFYSDKPVKIGDTWKITLPEAKLADDKNKEAQVETNGTATLVGKEAVDGTDTLKVKVTLDAKGKGKENFRTHFEGVGNLDATDYKMVKLTGLVQGNAGPIKKSDLTLTRLTGDAKAASDKKTDSDKKP